MTRTDRIISANPNWDALYSRLVQLPNDQSGEVFERLTQLYLLTHPEYRTQLDEVWRLNEVPERVRQRLRLPVSDEGIDIIAKTKSGDFWAIQCKFRSNTSKTLTYTELSTFTSLAFVTCKDISLAVVAHSCSKPVRKHKYLGRTTEIGLARWAELAPEDWRAIKAKIEGKKLRLVPRSPRPHQGRAIKAARIHFKKARRGRLIMPCGTGKSLTAFWIGKALNARSIIVAVPSLALIRQSLLDWTREFLAHGEIPAWLVVCSDASTANLERDELVGETYDLGIPTTTQVDEIVVFLKGRSSRRIVFTTYQSCITLTKAAKKAGFTFDLAIFDEAHKTVGVKTKAFAALLNESKISVRRRLFMTATERVLRGDSDDVFSMDDPAIYGECFHHLTFKQAIADKIISDYRVLTISINNAAIRTLVSQNRFIRFNGDEISAQSLAASIALRRAVKKYDLRHIISFHRSINAAKQFCDRQIGLSRVVSPKIASSHISSKKSAGDRAALMRDFVAEKRALMTNARCLTEGVDVPAIDCVLFADPKQSVIDIVQASGRALRPHKGKTFGYILLPLVVPKRLGLQRYADSTAFRQVTRTIAALSTQDERIVEEFRLIQNGRRSTGRIVNFSGDVPNGINLPLREFAKEVAVKIWDRVARANWRKFGEARDFVRSLGLKNQDEWHAYSRSKKLPSDIPSTPGSVYHGKGWKNLGDWLGTGYIHPKERKYRPFRLARAHVRQLGLKSGRFWNAFTKSGKLPADIPANPHIVYKNKGWVSRGDWLGTGVIASQLMRYRTFKKARAFARKLGFTTAEQWKEYAGSKKRPEDIPAAPHWTYDKKGWINMGDWLGTGRVANRQKKFLPYDKARAFVHELGFKSEAEWRVFAKTDKRPADIPNSPYDHYSGKGWKGMGDWLGTGTVAPRLRKYRPYPKARAFARSLKLKSGEEWHAFAKSGKLPIDIPNTPRLVYKGKGWVSMGAFLGTGVVAPNLKEYRPFVRARAFARKLRLRSEQHWRKFTKTSKLPTDIPATPNQVYRDRGWRGMGDWLGYDN